MADEKSGIKQRLRSSTSHDESEIKPENEPSTPKLKKSQSEDFAKLIADMNPRWKNWWIRGIFTFVLLAGFAVVIYFGPKAMLLLIVAIQVKCYHEIISVGHQNYKKYNLPMFRTLSWYFLGSTNYFFYGEITAEYFAEFLQREELFKFLLRNHRLISFALYTIGIMFFVLSLKKNYYKVQFALFGWYQLTLLIVLTPSHLIIQNMLTGLIWFFLPVSMVICNDIFAYVFGFFFGKTRLIKLSPKKTWEGFMGGFFATVLYGQIVCELMCQHQYFHCPPQFNGTSLKFAMECTASPTYQLSHQFTLNPTIQHVFGSLPGVLSEGIASVLSILGIHLTSNFSEVWMYPMIWHGIVLACFSSLIAPFGGFFASGFKRAFKIKDFGDTIPGHGGIMDRFDCQYLMATFVNVYVASVIRAYNPHKLLQQVMFMEKEDQIQFYNKLQYTLSSQGLI
ncbi:phosphatidate cytidylyltransferase 2-like [Hydractinia symbiolongicarpus]|uniref:phosphatidate cytidylyltransferase 2-like n=1 Tax=Hydractinia symbiolongicarpus TaxID=13093 RepID=UPI00254F73B9|nr:phosphatidate cytidylyltransferase 2-like [Hydractinia symbiolongicarpus]